jgi:hypothetical protein
MTPATRTVTSHTGATDRLLGTRFIERHHFTVTLCYVTTEKLLESVLNF